jgi:hypothetical protein
MRLHIRTFACLVNVLISVVLSGALLHQVKVQHRPSQYVMFLKLPGLAESRCAPVVGGVELRVEVKVNEWVKGKAKGKVHTITCHEDPEVE